MFTLSWEVVTSFSYGNDDVTVTLTPEQLTVLVQILAVFNSPEMWDDYLMYGDEIDAMVSELNSILIAGVI